MFRVDEFRARAALCEQRAELAKNSEAKRQLLAAAQQWRDLASLVTSSDERGREHEDEDRRRVNRLMCEQRLAEAEEHVSLGEKHVQIQRNKVAELEQDGHDTVTARKLLATFEDVQNMHVADRDRLRKKLAL